MDPEIEKTIRSVTAAATPAPWGWFGNLKAFSLYLATPKRGRKVVMNFVRWGMANAQPSFRNDERCVMREATTYAEVDHNKDILGLNHADARFIAESREWVPILLSDIDDLRAELAEKELENKALMVRVSELLMDEEE